ncbi:MAG: type II secretion system protein [Mogibacterium sp.]|nr:type II secretion system protein [Mogibacterium sp.]
MTKDTGRIKPNRKTAGLRTSRGMTMAEMLITVAIILILAAVGFITLARYQRMLAQIERDGYAKEIFIAAQNHLSTARANGYDLTAKEVKQGTAYGEKVEDEKGVYLLIVNKGKVYTKNGNVDINSAAGTGTLIDVMLPFASIDETVRSGSNSYVIKYQPKSGRILDVFYVSRGSGKFDFTDEHDLLQSGDYTSFMNLAKDDDVSKKARRDYSVDGRRAILGWYGSAQASGLPENVFKVPEIKVINDDTLRVEVTNPSGNESVSGSQLRLIITGKTKNGDNFGKTAVYLKKTGGISDDRLTSVEVAGGVKYTYYLDDITEQGRHFCELSTVKNANTNHTAIINGDDIEVTAVAYSKSVFANIAYSEAVSENSLFESIKDPKEQSSTGPVKKIASVSRIRHLENLDRYVSNAGFEENKTNTANPKIALTEALQTRNISWGQPYSGGVYDFKKDTSNPAHYTGYKPISPAALLYDGLRHSITDVPAVSDSSGNSGLFGSTAAKTEIRNLRLVDCSAAGTNNAGALAGVLKAAKVSNVVAYNSNKNNYESKTISNSGSGNAGGLAGSMEGGSVIYSGAALRVRGGSNAGGFIGKVDSYSSGNASSQAVIRACYSGGHTVDGDYYEGENNDEPVYNVQASQGGNAGGFIGSALSAKIRYCYSTCSASAGNDVSDRVSGFIGSVTAVKVRNSYCTGLVNGTNAFLGTGNLTNSADNHYYMIINEKKGSFADGVDYKEPGDRSVSAFDDDAASFNTFTGGTWNDAKPYDNDIKTYYDNRYSLRTVTQLANKKTDRIPESASGFGAYFVNTHYGDWPAPETFIINN